jgi:hypothetical protein
VAFYDNFSEPTPRRRVLLEEVGTDPKIAKKLSIFYGTRRSITCSQEQAIGS